MTVYNTHDGHAPWQINDGQPYGLWNNSRKEKLNLTEFLVKKAIKSYVEIRILPCIPSLSWYEQTYSNVPDSLNV